MRASALEVALPGLYVSVGAEMDLERMGAGYGCGLAEVRLRVMFGGLRDGTVGRRLPPAGKGRGDERGAVWDP